MERPTGTGGLARAVEEAGASLRTEMRPGDIGELIRMHGILYADESGYSMAFEAYVAKTFSGCAWPLGPRERMWLVERDGALRGSVAIVQASEAQAKLRWLLLQPALRGYGIGRALVEEAVAFSRARGYSSILLWTEGSLETAASIYRQAGFVKTETKTSEVWGAVRSEVRWDMSLVG